MSYTSELYSKPVLADPTLFKNTSGLAFTAKQKGGWVEAVQVVLPVVSDAPPKVNKGNLQGQLPMATQKGHPPKGIFKSSTRSKVPNIPPKSNSQTAKSVRPIPKDRSSSSNTASHPKASSTGSTVPKTNTALPEWDSFVPTAAQPTNVEQCSVNSASEWRSRLLYGSMYDKRSNAAAAPPPLRQSRNIVPKFETFESDDSGSNDYGSVTSSDSASKETEYSVESFLMQSSAQLERALDAKQSLNRERISVVRTDAIAPRKQVSDPQLRIHRSGSIDVMLPARSRQDNSQTINATHQTLSHSTHDVPITPNDKHRHKSSTRSAPASSPRKDPLESYFKRQEELHKSFGESVPRASDGFPTQTQYTSHHQDQKGVNLNTERFEMGLSDRSTMPTWAHLSRDRPPKYHSADIQIAANKPSQKQFAQRELHVDELVQRNQKLYESNVELLNATQEMQSRINELELLQQQLVKNNEPSVKSVDGSDEVAHNKAHDDNIAEYLLTVGRALEREFAQVIAESKVRNMEAIRSEHSTNRDSSPMEQFFQFLDHEATCTLDGEVKPNLSSLAMRLTNQDDILSKLQRLSTTIPVQIVERVAEFEQVVERIWGHFEQRDGIRRELYQKSIERVRQRAKDMVKQVQRNFKLQQQQESKEANEKIKATEASLQGTIKDLQAKLQDAESRNLQLTKDLDREKKECKQKDTKHAKELEAAKLSIRNELEQKFNQKRQIDAKALSAMKDEVTRVKSQAQSKAEDEIAQVEANWSRKVNILEESLSRLESKNENLSKVIQTHETNAEKLIEEQVNVIQQQFVEKVNVLQEKSQELEEQNNKHIAELERSHQEDIAALRKECGMQVDMARVEAQACREQIISLTNTHESEISELKEQHLLREAQFDKRIRELQIELARVTTSTKFESLVQKRGTRNIGSLSGIDPPMFGHSVDTMASRALFESMTYSSDSDSDVELTMNQLQSSPTQFQGREKSPTRAGSSSPTKRTPPSPAKRSRNTSTHPRTHSHSTDHRRDTHETLLANPLLMHLSSKCHMLEHEVEHERSLRKSMNNTVDAENRVERTVDGGRNKSPTFRSRATKVRVQDSFDEVEAAAVASVAIIQRAEKHQGLSPKHYSAVSEGDESSTGSNSPQPQSVPKPTPRKGATPMQDIVETPAILQLEEYLASQI